MDNRPQEATVRTLRTRLRRWSVSVTVAAIAALVPAAASAATYSAQAATPPVTPAGYTNWTTCGNVTAISVATMSTGALACTNNSVAVTVAINSTSNVVMFVASAPYATNTQISGSATNKLMVASSSTTNSTFKADLGYVSGGTFTSFGQVTFPVTATGAQTWQPNFSTITNQIVPAGAYLAVNVSFTNASTGSTRTATAYVGTNGGGVTGSNSAQFNVTETPLTPPAAPTGLAVGTPTATSLPVSWTAVTGATSYSLDRSTDPTFATGVTTTSGITGTSSTATGLTGDTTYYFRVAAVGPGGTSAESTSASGLTLPGTPTGLAFSAVSSNQVTVTFTEPAGGATSYTLQYSTSSTFASGVLSQTGLTGGTGTVSTPVTGLTAGTVYYFRAFGVNASGNGANSATANVTTAPAAPTLTVGTITATSVAVSWTAVTGATSYSLDRSTDSTFATGVTTTSVTGTSTTATGLTGDTTYYFRVAAVNGTTWTTAESNTGSGLTLPGTPGTPTFSNVQTSQITVSFTEPAGGAGTYTLQYSTSSTFASGVLNQTGLTGGSGTVLTTVTGLSASTTYYFRVFGVNATGNGANSPQASQTTALAAPTGLAVGTPTATTLTATWTAVTGATSYVVDYATDAAFTQNVSLNNSVTAPTVTFTTPATLTGDTTYYFRVAAVNANGTSAESATASGTTKPGTPGTPTFANVLTTQMDVSFAEPAGGATTYTLVRATDSAFTLNVVNTPGLTGGTGTVTTTVTGLAANTLYYFRVFGVNGSGNGANSPSASHSTALAAPTGLAVGTPTSSTLTATWTAVTGATSYLVDYATDAAFTQNVSLNNGVTAPTVTFTTPATLTGNTTYYFRVADVNANGTSAESTTASGLTKPGVPGTPTFSSITSTSVTVSWAAPAGGATTYTLQRATDSAFTLNVVSTANLTGTSTNVTGLTANGTFWFRVLAVNTAGSSAYSTGASVTLGNPPATAPTGLAVGSPTSSSLTATWGAVTGATSYSVDYATDSAFTQNLSSNNSVATTTYTPNTLTGNTTYWFRVAAVNAFGSGPVSASASGLTKPGTPGTPTFANTGLTQTDVSWAAPAGGAASYTLTRATDSAFTLNVVNTSGLTATTTTVTGLTTGTTYYFRVFAVNASGNSASSGTGSVTPANNAVTTGAVTTTVVSCNNVRIDAAFTNDANNNSVITVARATSAAGPFTSRVCTTDGGTASPRTCTDLTTAASSTYYYSVSWTDFDGVAGANPIITGAVVTPACASAALASTTQPTVVALTVGGAQVPVAKLNLTPSGGTVVLDSLSVANVAAAPAAAPNTDVDSLVLLDPSNAVVAVSTWNATTSRYVFAGLGYPLTGTTALTFTVAARAAYGATPGNKLQAAIAVADVVARAPGSIGGTAVNATSSPATGVFTIAAPAVAEGLQTSYSTAPMVNLLNPLQGGVVNGQFKLQVHVYSKAGARTANLTGLNYSTNGAAPDCTVKNAAMTESAKYYAPAASNPNEAVYEATLDAATLGQGTFTLRACARNAAGTVVSRPITIAVKAAGTGDGNLLVRDNSSQLCADCHAVKTHSSQATAVVGGTNDGTSKFGAWATTCRDCHTPHSTHNAYLFNERVTPPAASGTYSASRTVRFWTPTVGDSAAGTPSFVTSTNDGPCQACHTRTGATRPGTGANFTAASTTLSVGTATFASTDVGQWVLGPDGKSYKIAAYVSATQVTLATAYQGGTVTGAAFRFGPARWRNGTADANADTHYTSASGTQPCTDCHTHTVGFAGAESIGGIKCSGCHKGTWQKMNGTDVTIVSKHSLVGGSDAPTDSGVAWNTASPLSNNAPSTRSCVNMCHLDHVHNAPAGTTHDSNVYKDATTSTTRAMTRDVNGNVTAGNPARLDFDSATNTGMCASCHAGKAVATGRTVFDAAAFGASAHDYVTGGGATWQFSLHDGSKFDRNCTKCHASRAEGTTPQSSGTITAVHGTTDPNLLAGATNPNGTTAGFICYNCHGNATVGADRSGKDLATPMADASNHPTNSDAVHSTVAEATAAYGDGKFTGTNRHVSCMDCHVPHSAGKTKHSFGTNVVGTTSPIAYATGVAYASQNTVAWPTTSSATLTWKTSVAKEYELCLKCHSSFAFGTTPPTAPSGGSETDVARDFNTGNQSYHPVFGALPTTDPSATYGSVQVNAAQLCGSGNANCPNKDPAYTWAPGQTMYCSDCHGSDANAAGAQGPHGSAGKYLMKGPNRYWPTNATGSLWTISTAGAGLFCLNCHPNITSTNTPHSNGQHSGVACVVCHIAVPHGGKVSRLIVTRAAPQPWNYYAAGSNTQQLTNFNRAATYNGYSEAGQCGSGLSCYSGHTHTGGEAW